VSTLHDFGGVLDNLWTLSFGLSKFHGHGSWLVCAVALSTPHEFSNGCFHRNIGIVRMQVNMIALYLLPFFPIT
jgi:hypothetical protein